MTSADRSAYCPRSRPNDQVHLSASAILRLVDEFTEVVSVDLWVVALVVVAVIAVAVLLLRRR